MKDNGKMILKKEKELCGILIRTNTKDSGKKEKKMAMESIGIIMELYIKVILIMEENKDME